MFFPKPVVYVDVNRIRMSDLELLSKHGNVVVPVQGDPHRVVFTMAGAVPSPDQLFRWKPVILKEQK
jgi:hypothetical protein